MKAPTAWFPMISTPGNERGVVLDACVLVPMPLCDTLLRLAEGAEGYQPLWSEEILEEVDRALTGKLGLTEPQAERRIRFMRQHFPEAVVLVPPYATEALDCIPDANDRHVLGAAIHGGASLIISQNLKHFPADCLKRYSIGCETPDEFLLWRLKLDAANVMKTLDAQANAIGQSRAQVLANLKPMVPRFVQLAETHRLP